jgi:two-component system, LytTR family, response regulator
MLLIQEVYLTFQITQEDDDLPGQRLVTVCELKRILDAEMSPDTLRTLIVDDEPIARKVLREELELLPAIDLIGEADHGKAAIEMIELLRPDLVFLDLQMPSMTGFEVMRSLQSGPLPIIVVVTAYDQYALEALNAGAVDYLLKPVSEDRLKRAVDRALALKGKPARIAEMVAQTINVGTSAAKGRKVVGRSGQEYFLLDLNDVLAFQADGEIVWIVTAKNKFYATQTLRTIQEKLPPDQFQRVHRNSIVNLNHIKKMAVMTSQRWLVTLTNGMELVVSKRLAKNVRTVLDW